MCAFQCDAATVESHPAPLAEDVVLVSARKLPPLDLLPARVHNKKHCVGQDGRIFVNYRHGTHHSTITLVILRTRLWNIELFVHLLLVSSAVVLVVVVVSLCVRRTVCALHARTSLDTASSHRSLYLAVLCLALAILTVATKCYATATTVHPLSQQPSSQTPSQTTFLLPSTSSRHTTLRLVQSVPSSIAHSRIFLSRPDFFTTAKRKKRTSTDHGVLRYQGSNSDQLQVHNDTTSNITNSVTSVGVVRLRLDTSGPVRQQSTVRPMPSAHDEPTHTVSDDIAGGIETGGGTASGGSGGGSSDTGGGGGGNRFLALVISAALLTVTLGLITCVVNCYRDSTTTGTLPAGSTVQQHSLVVPVLGAEEHHVPVITQPITAPMLSVVSASAAGMDAGGGGAAGRLHRHVTRELAAQRDRQVRLHSVHTDLELDLPPSIALPDGEELPYGSSARLHIRDPEQESEIYQKCIRPPPNRTVFESESPPPYRSSSAGLLGSLGGSTSSNSTTGVSGSSDWSTGSTPFVVRCHSMSSTSTTTTKRTLEPQLTTPSAAAAAGPASATAAAAAAAATAGGGQKTDFLQRTVKIFTGKKNNTPLPQPAPTLPVVVVPTPGVRTTRRLAEQTAPTRAKHQGNV